MNPGISFIKNQNVSNKPALENILTLPYSKKPRQTAAAPVSKSPAMQSLALSTCHKYPLPDLTTSPGERDHDPHATAEKPGVQRAGHLHRAPHSW